MEIADGLYVAVGQYVAQLPAHHHGDHVPREPVGGRADETDLGLITRSVLTPRRTLVACNSAGPRTRLPRRLHREPRGVGSGLPIARRFQGSELWHVALRYIVLASKDSGRRGIRLAGAPPACLVQLVAGDYGNGDGSTELDAGYARRVAGLAGDVDEPGVIAAVH